MNRILIIDDDNDFRGAVKLMLEKAGYETADASDAQTGIELYSKTHYNLIIIDMFMPKIDGIQAIYRIMEGFNSPKIIAMTGACSPQKSNEDILALAKVSGAIEVFNKANDLKGLLAKVKVILKQ